MPAGTTAASMGWASKMGVGATSATLQIEFLSEDVRKEKPLVESPGMRGTRSHVGESVGYGPYVVTGSLTLEPRPEELAFFLPYILGGTAPGSTPWAVGDSLPSFFAQIDRVAKVFSYAGMSVDQARFSSRAGVSPNLQLALNLEGKTEAIGNAGTFPSIANTLSVNAPFVHQGAVITVGGTERNVQNVEIGVNNALVKDRFMGQTTRAQLPPGDRVVTFTCESPFTADEIDLYDLAVAGVAATVVYTNATHVLTFTLGNLKLPTRTPGVRGRTQETTFPLNFQAFKVGSTAELTVALTTV